LSHKPLQLAWVQQLQRIATGKIRLKSPNAISAGETFTAFLVSVVAGARRFAHTARLRADEALHTLLGMTRFPSDDTIRNLFKRFRQSLVVQFYEPLWAWQLARVPQRAEGYSLDLDSTVFERYGQQEGAKRGYNPRKHGRASITRCWRCWEKRGSFWTAGCAAGTRARTAGWWSFSRKR